MVLLCIIMLLKHAWILDMHLTCACCACSWGSTLYFRRNRKYSLTQQELDSAWTGPTFELATRYGQHLNIIFIAMLLGGGIPLLYISAGASNL